MDYRKRPSDRTFFVYDHSVVLREEDDPKNAIVYFYPHTVSVDTQCLFCGQLMGMVNFLKILCGSEPRVYKLKKIKFTTKHEGNFTLALAHDCRVPDSLATERLENLYRLFCMYHGSLGRVLKQCGGKRERFSSQMASMWNCYLPFVRQYGNNIMAIFQAVPTIHLPKTSSFIFLKSSHLLQWLKRKPWLLAGCLLYKNKVLCTQLTSDLTAWLLLIKPYQVHFPADKVKTDRELPFGVRILSIFLREEEYKLFSKRDIAQSRMSSLGRGATSETCPTDSTTQRKEANVLPAVQEYTESIDSTKQRQVSQVNVASPTVVSQQEQCDEMSALNRKHSKVDNSHLLDTRAELRYSEVRDSSDTVTSTLDNGFIPNVNVVHNLSKYGELSHPAATAADMNSCTKADIRDGVATDLRDGTRHRSIGGAGSTDSEMNVPKVSEDGLCGIQSDTNEFGNGEGDESVAGDGGTDRSRHAAVGKEHASSSLLWEEAQDHESNVSDYGVVDDCGTAGPSYGTTGDGNASDNVSLPAEDHDNSDSDVGETSRGTDNTGYEIVGGSGNVLIATAVSVLSHNYGENMVPKVCINEGSSHYEEEPFEIHINPLDSESSPEHSDSSSTVKVLVNSSKSGLGWTENNGIVARMSATRENSETVSEIVRSSSEGYKLDEQHQNGLVHSSIRNNALKQEQSSESETEGRSRNLSMQDSSGGPKYEMDQDIDTLSKTSPTNSMSNLHFLSKRRSLESDVHSNPTSVDQASPSVIHPNTQTSDQLNGNLCQSKVTGTGDACIDGEFPLPNGASTPLLRSEIDDGIQLYNDVGKPGRVNSIDAPASDVQLWSIPSVIISAEDEDGSPRKSHSDTLTEDVQLSTSWTTPQGAGPAPASKADEGEVSRGRGEQCRRAQSSTEMDSGADENDIKQVDGMVNVSLYVQAHSDTVLLFLAENDLIEDKDTLLNMWQASMIELAELEIDLQQALETPADKQDADQMYNFLQYSPFDRSLKGNITNMMTVQDRDFVHIVDNMHDIFNSDEDIDQLIVRGQQNAVLGQQTAAYQTFFQPFKTSATAAAASSSMFSYFSSARPGRLEAQAEKTLFKDHGISLL